ncbi:hypothetical protein [Paenibacillus thiaminolyticus]|uniref:hypothetical protein n=1 Tax=Paenibacillus thiaminolyticus TaxID=49283 RepID=UPI0025428478|nr:hypothetical protein [Paenibacillus thiaminolyticus]WII40424.1 hypothetical protein O0V01_17325 [Paenibacillus thiaminolyticus]
MKQQIKPYFKEILLKDIKPIMYQKSIQDLGISRQRLKANGSGTPKRFALLA